MDSGKLDKDKARDTGLAMVLILLIAAYILRPDPLIAAAAILLVMVMVWPGLFRPLAGLWYGFSQLLGSIVSKIILTIVFFLIVTPMGLLRRLCGADPMRIRLWKKGDGSVLVDRQHQYRPEDLEKPY